MTDTRAEQPLGLPWTVRLFESAPIAPICRVLRFALYVFYGLGAWVGAALMERLLSAALR